MTAHGGALLEEDYMSKQDEAKKLAGRKVIEEFSSDGMKIGLGSGTTSHFFVRELGKHVANGLKLICTTTSRSTNDVAREVGIKLTDPNEIRYILEKSHYIATTGRPGPVLIDIPKDIQFAKTNYSQPKKEKKVNGKSHNKFTDNEIFPIWFNNGETIIMRMPDK